MWRIEVLHKYYINCHSGHVEHTGEEREVYRVLLGKPEGRRPLGRPRRRWVDNIRMDLQEVRCGYTDWIGLAQDRDRWRTLVSAVMNLRVPWNAGNFLTSKYSFIHSFKMAILTSGSILYGLGHFCGNIYLKHPFFCDRISYHRITSSRRFDVVCGLTFKAGNVPNLDNFSSIFLPLCCLERSGNGCVSHADIKAPKLV